MPSFQEIKTCGWLVVFLLWFVFLLNFETALNWVTGLANCGCFLQGWFRLVESLIAVLLIFITMQNAWQNTVRVWGWGSGLQWDHKKYFFVKIPYLEAHFYLLKWSRAFWHTVIGFPSLPLRSVWLSQKYQRPFEKKSVFENTNSWYGAVRI